MAQRDDGFALSVLDAERGELVTQHPLAGVASPMQLSLAPRRMLFQGTTTAILRIAPSP